MLLILPAVSTTGFGASPLPFVEPKDGEESSEDEEISGRPGKRPSVGISKWVLTGFLGSVTQKKLCPGC